MQPWKRWILAFDRYMETPKKQDTKDQSRNNMVQIVRILNSLYMKDNHSEYNFSEKPTDKLLTHLSACLNKEEQSEMLFCNTCNLFSIWVDTPSLVWKSLILKLLKPRIRELVYVAKEKTGNWRKNSALLLAKMSSSNS